MFDIVFQPNNSRRRVFHVAGSSCVVGRARNNDLPIDSRSIAKHHAEFSQHSDGVHIRDLGSSAGSYVNRQRVVEYGPLDTLDEVVLGDVRIGLQKVVPATPLNSEQTRLVKEPMENRFTGFEVMNKQDGVYTASESHYSESFAYWGRVVHERLLDAMDLRRKDVSRMSDEQLRQESASLISEIIQRLLNELPEDLNADALHEQVLNESVGLGPLEAFLADDAISEVMVNNHREIFVEKNGRLEQSTIQFSSDKTVYSVIERIITPLGRRIDESSPVVDARLKDGSRVNAVIPPLALKGPSLTIRKFPKHRLDFSKLVHGESLTQDMVDFLQVCVEQRRNIVVAGGTGSGKTTLLNLLSAFIPHDQRIVTIEDAAELKLDQPNLVSLESRPSNSEGTGEITIRDLMRNALRMRPDRIVVGECRGGEAIDMLQAMNTGHNGSLTTVHANSPRDVVSRLEVLVLMGGIEIPIMAIREQLASAVDIIIQQNRLPCGHRKVTQISEVVGVESGTIQLQDIYKFKPSGIDVDGTTLGQFEASGFIPTFYEFLREQGVQLSIHGFNRRINEGAA